MPAPPAPTPGSFLSGHPADLDRFRACVPCTAACPVITDVAGYLRAIRNGDYTEANRLNAATNLFPGLLGRVCSRPCEKACRHADPDLGEAVEICRLKRFAADQGHFACVVPTPPAPPTGKRVAVVGAGPAGLTAGYLLSRLGHAVEIYEMMPRVGGMLTYGIPPFRLPKDEVEREIGNTASWGLRVNLGIRVGADVPFEDLLSANDAVLVAAGCYAARKPSLPGVDLPGVFSGLEFMMTVNAGGLPPVGPRVLVIGGGFTAVDCARAARRLGASDVRLCIRTTEEDLVVTRDQIVESKREGVRFLNLVSSVEILGDCRVEGVRFRYTRLGGARPTGERLTHPIEGSDFTLDADSVILAVGQAPDSRPFRGDLPDLRADAATGATGRPGVWAAGDFARGASTVIEAMGNARRVVWEIHESLAGGGRPGRRVRVGDPVGERRDFRWDFTPRQTWAVSEIGERLADPSCETERGFDPEAGTREARRCYGCDEHYVVDPARCTLCAACIEACPRECIGYARAADDPGQPGTLRWEWVKDWPSAVTVAVDNARCIRCGACAAVCPRRCVATQRIGLEPSRRAGRG